ncbi:hypothetical protein BN1058_01081 [Paraliobacillus sp. PM-2]|uniref:hypothetical protein n=1 Tax=Paraliobacillus sp. PM-2 TaxID=1462524 RepID=UPI00061C9B62|nr:hypothetical protein [Paraliobacillus sp. PM-2]CQR46806.1 hypothetical protein BN1058_01081 [Paraliobacillus sp. PM-2]
MKQAINRIFWGYLFVLIEIHIIMIDILAEPVGYWLIFSGVTMLQKDFTIAHKARKLSLVLIFISTPTVFVQQNAGTDQLGQLSFLSGWSLYMIVLGLVQLILVFYIFQLIMVIVHKHGDTELIRRSARTFSTYIIVMLITELFNTFTINFSGDALAGITIVIIIISFIMQISFLILLLALRKINDANDLTTI